TRPAHGAGRQLGRFRGSRRTVACRTLPRRTCRGSNTRGERTGGRADEEGRVRWGWTTSPFSGRAPAGSTSRWHRPSSSTSPGWPRRYRPPRHPRRHWLDDRLAALRDEHDEPPQWSFTLTELSVLANFYRRCADRGFAVYADF